MMEYAGRMGTNKLTNELPSLTPWSPAQLTTLPVPDKNLTSAAISQNYEGGFKVIPHSIQ